MLLAKHNAKIRKLAEYFYIEEPICLQLIHQTPTRFTNVLTFA
jgi:hypothetical protein